MSAGPLNTSEVEWYLRDHFFRQSATGRSEFDLRSLPDEMVRLYLRFRNIPMDQLTEKIPEAVDCLALLKVVQRAGNTVKLQGKLERLQCSKCFYICYLGSEEARKCLRCPSTELAEFPKKKQPQ